MNIKSIPPPKNGKVPNFQTFFQWLLIGYKKYQKFLRIFAKTSLFVKNNRIEVEGNEEL